MTNLVVVMVLDFGLNGLELGPTRWLNNWLRTQLILWLHLALLWPNANLWKSVSNHLQS